MLKIKSLAKSRVNLMPETSGVYIFGDKKDFFYIGKAINLKKRVRNHLSQKQGKNNLFLNKVKRIKYIKTDSEIEALILEANLIKKYRPKYNFAWQDDKNYFFIAITKEKFSRVFLTHQTKLKIKYLGPFVDGKSLKQALKTLRKIFLYRTCKTLPKKPCLWYQLNYCQAPCFFGQKIEKEYQKNIKNLVKVFEGKKGRVLNNLKKEMKKASKLQDYEKALKLREQISSLEKVLAHTSLFKNINGGLKEKGILQIENQYKEWENVQKALQKTLKTERNLSRIEAYDVSNIQGKEATGSMVTFTRGLPDKNFYRRFKIKFQKGPNDTAMIKEILSRRLKHKEWPYPDLILVDGGKGQLNAALKAKTKISGSKNIKIISLAKRKNELFVEKRKKSLFLKNLPKQVSNLFLRLRDEAHRFAIDYHHKLRNKNLVQ